MEPCEFRALPPRRRLMRLARIAIETAAAVVFWWVVYRAGM